MGSPIGRQGATHAYFLREVTFVVPSDISFVALVRLDGSRFDAMNCSS
jgi:hypothetical protein